MRTRTVLAAVAMTAALLTVAPTAQAADATCVSAREGEATDTNEARGHAEKRYGTRSNPYRGRFEFFADGTHHRRYWASYNACWGRPGVRLWVDYKTSNDRVVAWTWVYLEPGS